MKSKLISHLIATVLLPCKKIFMGRLKNYFTILTLFISAITYGQASPKNYEKEWKRVGNFMKKNLPKSAVDEVIKIYTLAKKENQAAQIIKSLVFMAGLQSENRENSSIL